MTTSGSSGSGRGSCAVSIRQPGSTRTLSSPDCAADQVVVENNALSDIIENKASGMSQEEKYQKAQNALVKATEEFKAHSLPFVQYRRKVGFPAFLSLNK